MRLSLFDFWLLWKQNVYRITRPGKRGKNRMISLDWNSDCLGRQHLLGCRWKRFNWIKAKSCRCIRCDEGLTFETSALKPFTVANLRYQLICDTKLPCYTLPPTQHQFFYKLTRPLFMSDLDLYVVASPKCMNWRLVKSQQRNKEISWTSTKGFLSQLQQKKM